MRTNIEYMELDATDIQLLNEYGITLRQTNYAFVSGNGYISVKTSRKNIKELSDKILNLHWLKGIIKVAQLNLLTFEEAITLTRKYKLECHHKDTNKQNNSIENLEPFLTERQHQILDYLAHKEN